MNYRHPLYAHEIGHALGYASHDNLVKTSTLKSSQKLLKKTICINKVERNFMSCLPDFEN